MPRGRGIASESFAQLLRNSVRHGFGIAFWTRSAALRNCRHRSSGALRVRSPAAGPASIRPPAQGFLKHRLKSVPKGTQLFGRGKGGLLVWVWPMPAFARLGRWVVKGCLPSPSVAPLRPQPRLSPRDLHHARHLRPAAPSPATPAFLLPRLPPLPSRAWRNTSAVAWLGMQCAPGVCVSIARRFRRNRQVVQNEEK